jgi:two-component sensor histidine kinase
MQHFSAKFCACLFLPGLLLTLPGIALKAQPGTRAEADSLLRVLAASQADANRVEVLLRLAEYQVYKPGESKADLDSARTYAGQARALSRKLGHYRGEARSLNLLGTVSREARDFARAIAYQKAAIALCKRRKEIQAEAESYRLLAHALRDKGDIAAARKQVQRAIDLAAGNGYAQQAAEAYLELGNTYANDGEEYEAKISSYRQALEIFTQAGNRRRQADVGKDLGDLYQLQGKHAEALIELRKALALYQSIDYPHLQGVYDLLGHVSTAMGDYQEGIKYGLSAVERAEALRDSSLQLCTIYNRVGITYYQLNQFEKAHAYFAKSLTVAQKHNDRASAFLLTGSIAIVLAKLNQNEKALSLLLATARKYPPQNLSDSILLDSRLLAVYTRLKQYASAQRHCDQLFAMSDKLGKNHLHRYVAYGQAIQFFLASKQYGQTRKYLAKFQRYSREARDPRSASYFHLWSFQLDSTQANYPAAIKHYQRYKQVEDSLFNETKSRQIASLDVLHETERKEKDIQLKAQSIKALTRDRQLQSEQIRRDELIRNVMIGGAVLLLLLLGVIYNRYRLKRRSNQLLQAQRNVLQAQQEEINRKNEHLSELLLEKDSLLGQKDILIGEKEGLLSEKDALLSGQERLLAEKERLLKEIHHRVKNNLQVVMSLLNSQAASLQDQAALSAIQESQHRVQAMALIHQKLYQSEGVARIPMHDYIGEVVAYLSDSYCLDHRVRFRVQVAPIELDVTQAVPLGLIINEAITNAFKYAFPDGRPGTVSLSLQQMEEATYQLTIADDGVGLPVHYDPAQSRSLGMTLLHGFSGQLGGELVITSPPGLSIKLVFEEELSAVFAPVAQAG